MTLQKFNQLPEEDVIFHLMNCCGSEKWVREVLKGLPYGNAQLLLQHGQSVWYTYCHETDWLEAFTHHPRIGDKSNLSDKVKDSIHLAVGEQSGVEENDEKLLLRLNGANIEYEVRFGFTFIVFASGKTGKEMLGLLEDRLENSVEDEIRIAMGEQWKITLLRLKKMLVEVAFPEERSQVTTHVLDTSAGKPARGVGVSLFRYADPGWQKIASGRTNEDGRVAELLPAGVKMENSKYKLLFDTDAYFGANAQRSFYPEVQIVFSINDDSHYHVPLLLNPFGYSTYRGS